jgi:hypothetical protein
MCRFVPRAVGLMAMLALGSGCRQHASGEVVGVENRCSVELEVSVGDVEPLDRWVPVAVGAWEKVTTVDSGVPFLFWFRVAGDPSTPVPVQLEATDVVRSVGGPLDLLIVVQGAQCPAM